MDDPFAPLYPPAAGDVTVVHSLPAPRFPTAPPNKRNLGTAREFYGPALLAEYVVAGGDRVAFVDKAFPHSRYDVMMLVSDDYVRCAFPEVAPATRTAMLEVAERFVDFVSRPDTIDRYALGGGHLHITYNYDRHTVDRENSMYYDKRFHLHLNYTPGRDLNLDGATRWLDIPDMSLRRRLLDPVAYLAASVMRDATGGAVAGLPLMSLDDHRDVRLGLPAGPKIKIESWRALTDGRFDRAAEELHLVADRVWRELHTAFTGEVYKPAAWYRPGLLKPDAITDNLAELDWLSEASRSGLGYLGRLLREVSDEQMAVFRANEHARIHCLTLGGLDYALSLFSGQFNSFDSPLRDAEELYLAMQVKLFADIGGAGLPAIGGVPIVRIDRASGAPMTSAEVADRTAFRRDFLVEALPAVAIRHRMRPVD